LPEYQQTIFDEIEYTLSYVDDEDIISSDVLQLFIDLNLRKRVL
jgi:hypothetical protein